MAKTKRLTSLTLKEVSLVRTPANKGARVLFTKQKQTGGSHVATQTEVDPTLALTSAAEGLRKALDAVEVDDAQERSALISAGLAQFSKALSDVVPNSKASGKKTDDEAAQSAAEESDEDPTEEAMEEVTKALTELTDEVVTIKKALEASVEVEKAATARADSLAAELAVLKGNIAEQKLMEEATELSKGLVTPASEIAEVLRALPEGKGRETYVASLKKEQAAANLKALTTPIGSASPESGTAADKLDSLAKQYATEHKVSFAKAMEAVVATNEALYTQTLRQ